MVSNTRKKGAKSYDIQSYRTVDNNITQYTVHEEYLVERWLGSDFVGAKKNRENDTRTIVK
jgi:hypothetical protein